MASLPIMPVMTDALLSDAGDLPNALFGAYCRLLFRWWREGAAPEKDERRLARWAGLTTAELQDLKEFLTETPEGWVQAKLVKIYAKQMDRSEKARVAANARHNHANALRNSGENGQNCDQNRTYDANALNFDANAYANARKTDAIHEPLLLSKDKERRAGARKNFSGGRKKAAPAPIPAHSDPECAPGWTAMTDRFGPDAMRAWFMAGEKPALRKSGAGFVIEAAHAVTRSRIDQQYGAILNEIFGKRGWRVEPPP